MSRFRRCLLTVTARTLASGAAVDARDQTREELPPMATTGATTWNETGV